MDSISSVSPSMILPPTNSLRHHRISVPFQIPNRTPRLSSSIRFLPEHSGRRFLEVSCKSTSREEEEVGSDGDDVDKALNLDGTIPGSSDEFVKRVSSRAYDIRRNLHQTFDTSSYDVLEKNPWRESPKPVYVLTHQENQLCTMKTRRNRSEVETELGQLFSKARKKQPRAGTKFQMLVEDIREGVLVFEDVNEAARYCDLLQGKGQGCEGVAEIEASSVFDLCQKMKALAVLFRKGGTPPLPESLELNLKARKRSLED